MKRLLAFLLTVCLLCGSFALAEEAVAVQDGAACGVTIWRNHVEIDTDQQKIALDYPVFECGDEPFVFHPHRKR